MQFRPGGAKVPHDEFLRTHADLLRSDEWIIDGFGNAAIAWERFTAADTLIYIDLPLITHHRWVTKRLIKGLFANPPGWPESQVGRRTVRCGAVRSQAIVYCGSATVTSRRSIVS